MANEEQLAILHQGVEVWNEWRAEHPNVEIDLKGAQLSGTNLSGVNLNASNLTRASLNITNLHGANLVEAKLFEADLNSATLDNANLRYSNLREADLNKANLRHSDLRHADLSKTVLAGSNFSSARVDNTSFGDIDLSDVIGLEDVRHRGPSTIGTDTLTRSKGKIHSAFLRGCGLSDWEIEQAKLYNPDLSNDGINQILYKIYDLRATQALQVSPLFISYSHSDRAFVDKVEVQLNQKGIRFWRDIHDMKAGRIEKQIDSAISQGRTVLLVLSENSFKSDWVEHEVRTARQLEKDMERDVLCPVALDDSWKSSHWPKRIMEQIMEYNILDFSAWEDEGAFDGMFRRLIDGLELFYKG